jgi:hypothetical protein
LPFAAKEIPHPGSKPGFGISEKDPEILLFLIDTVDRVLVYNK